VTTAEGRRRLILTLLDPSTAMLARLAEEYGLPELNGALTPERIHVFADAPASRLPISRRRTTTPPPRI